MKHTFLISFEDNQFIFNIFCDGIVCLTMSLCFTNFGNGKFSLGHDSMTMEDFDAFVGRRSSILAFDKTNGCTMLAYAGNTLTVAVSSMYMDCESIFTLTNEEEQELMNCMKQWRAMINEN